MDEKASLKEEIKQENMGNMEEVENEREDQLEKITLQELYKSIGKQCCRCIKISI